MKYRTLGKQTKVSILGFGAMRFPVLDNDQEKIDRIKSEEMLRYAIDQGINYIDTAYPYHKGSSEIFLGEFLSRNGFREKILLATKLPAWLIESKADFDKYFNEQKSRLKTGFFDFYLLHSLNSKTWKKIMDLDVLSWAESKIESGEIRQFGFSFHDDLKTFKTIVDAYDNWDFCQIQYNYMDIDYQAGREGMLYAARKGISIIVMEPLRGGQIAKEPPESVGKIWKRYKTANSLVDRALQWLWNQKEINIVLSGMSSLEQVKENITSADRAEIGSLTPQDLAVYDKVREAYLKLSPVPCTACRYCLPCPEKVDIPKILEIYNMAKMYDDMPRAVMIYNWIKEENRADRCIDCGICEEKCPQNIKIRNWLRKANDLLSQTGS